MVNVNPITSRGAPMPCPSRRRCASYQGRNLVEDYGLVKVATSQANTYSCFSSDHCATPHRLPCRISLVAVAAVASRHAATDVCLRADRPGRSAIDFDIRSMRLPRSYCTPLAAPPCRFWRDAMLDTSFVSIPNHEDFGFWSGFATSPHSAPYPDELLRRVTLALRLHLKPSAASHEVRAGKRNSELIPAESPSH